MSEDIKVEWGKPLPELKRKKKDSKYTPIIEEFLRRSDTTACIGVEGISPQAIAAGLKWAINALQVGGKVHVSNRAEQGVWLSKYEPKNENMTRPPH
jgi:hypothetical protein